MPLEHHEAREQLPAEVLEQHRAVESVIEELEAAMWYQERAATSSDAELKSILEHNRDEEIEHASMLLEWLRRNFPGFDEEMKTYLFTDMPILEAEEAATSGDEQPKGDSTGSGASGSLNIGSMKEGE